MTFVRAFAEDMPFPSASFDAVISVNAIDHVDDFARAASEISRVLKKDGVLRMQVHYHPPRELEPYSLTDEDVLAHFGHLGIEKISEEVPSAQLVTPVPAPRSIRGKGSSSGRTTRDGERPSALFARVKL